MSFLTEISINQLQTELIMSVSIYQPEMAQRDPKRNLRFSLSMVLFQRTQDRSPTSMAKSSWLEFAFKSRIKVLRVGGSTHHQSPCMPAVSSEARAVWVWGDSLDSSISGGFLFYFIFYIRRYQTDEGHTWNRKWRRTTRSPRRVDGNASQRSLQCKRSWTAGLIL